MAMTIYNIAIIGYGVSAKIFHIPFIEATTNFRLYGIVQRRPRPGSSASADYPTIQHYKNAEDMFADKEVDVVVITTPPDSHFEFSKRALESGKHVLTEKPFVPTSQEAEALISIAKKHNKLISVYQNRRWDLDFLTLKHLVKNGSLGRIWEINTHFDRYQPEPRTPWAGELTIASGGSVIFELGTHLIDQVYSIFKMPAIIRARMWSHLRGETDFERPDALAAELVYSPDLSANIRISSHSTEATQPRFWVRGTKGSYHKHALDPQEDQLFAGMKPTELGYCMEEPEKTKLMIVRDGSPVEYPVPCMEPQTYLQFYRQFAAAITDDREEDIPVTASEAKDVLEIIEAIIESAKTGRDVVVR
ncbi:Scyllo-inositol 2-dehydrogenase (NADP(+)) [Pleurostoma richardsiae]|uniref:Scyllo-inositol 2-dehydrogenase (NADP(+)) n=1 Tax=Pleurostoma richardsiae TaxID=41990 RepID=A0AA38VGY0_9PEZI|nr:Scyllo-inositol 2-dehydrogenase (NADP(+)) [Pleurostoma richardsiae]